MELNPYELDLLVLNKELKRQEEEFLQSLIISNDEGFQTSSIETLKELQSSQEVIEALKLNSQLYREMSQIDKAPETSFSHSDYLTKISKLNKINQFKISAVNSFEYHNSASAGTIFNDFMRYTRGLVEELESGGLDSQEFTKLMNELIIEIDKIMEAKSIEIEKNRFRKYIEDFKFMLKAFEPGSSSAEATEVHIDSFKQLLSYL